MAATAPTALHVRGLRKAYGAAVALQGFSMDVRAGEIRALIGQNGCGKSTFVKALTGVVDLDAGSIELNGGKELVGLGGESRRIAVIHQDVGVADGMTVFENIDVAANQALNWLAPIRTKTDRQACSRLMAELGIQLPLNARVGSLTTAEKALLAIVRAMRHTEESGGVRVLVLDEPTAALSRPEANRLLDLMRRLAANGWAVVFISHRLAEVMDVCHSATVMRAGVDVAHLEIAKTTRDELSMLMLGKRVNDFYPRPPHLKTGPNRLTLEGLAGDRLKGIDLRVKAGEVVGVTGLAGMGHEELPALLCGAQTATAGRCFIDGREGSQASPQEAHKAGLVVVPRERLREAVWSAGTAEENLTLPVLRQHFQGRLNRRELTSIAREMMSGYGINPAEPELPLSAFSGGNQQKIVFAKWLQLDPAVLVLDEPTQGVDLGAAARLLGCMQDAAAKGCAVLVLSGDHEQLASVCHRVLVVHDGRVTAELAAEELTEANLLQASQGTTRRIGMEQMT